ncbi:MAG TPA: anhydro-N-acetylmuramic acid kinase [Candidatus Acidoferrales bacterium]|nr:anhydro-N-acetylmuramic acid kinase [Candidatus Acidoferrales bacterium]
MKRVAGELLVLGLMSGTSADGIDVAVARISGEPANPKARLIGFADFPYPPKVRQAVLRVANGGATTTREISQLNFLLGELFAEAALRACRKFRVPPDRISLIGSHGQTIYHQGAADSFLGARVSSTLQIAEPAVIAERTGITTIADFRPADMAAGGQGAPLVPFVDYLLYRHPRRGRVALNVGGIANVTVIPAGANAGEVFAFDTGPGNMVIDALASHFTRGRLRFDRDAGMAQRGKLLPPLLKELVRHPYFRKTPPKTAGREEFGATYAEQLIARGKKIRARSEDLMHTATALTAASIADAFHRFIFRRARLSDLILSGGGARNPLIVAYLSALLPGVTNVSSDALGVPSDAKEAFAFAILAYEAWHRSTNNLPSATGARHPAVLGKICHARPR